MLQEEQELELQEVQVGYGGSEWGGGGDLGSRGVEDLKEGTIFIVKDEADLLQEEQELELQEVQVGHGGPERGGGELGVKRGVEDSKEGRIFFVKDEADLLQEVQKLELQEVQVGHGGQEWGGGGGGLGAKRGVEDSKEGRIFIVKDEADLLQEEQ